MSKSPGFHPPKPTIQTVSMVAEDPKSTPDVFTSPRPRQIYSANQSRPKGKHSFILRLLYSLISVRKFIHNITMWSSLFFSYIIFSVCFQHQLYNGYQIQPHSFCTKSHLMLRACLWSEFSKFWCHSVCCAASMTGNRIYQHENKGVTGPQGEQGLTGVRTVGPCLDGLLLWLQGFSHYVTLSIGELDPCLAAVGLAAKQTGRKWCWWANTLSDTFLGIFTWLLKYFRVISEVKQLV